MPTMIILGGLFMENALYAISVRGKRWIHRGLYLYGSTELDGFISIFLFFFKHGIMTQSSLNFTIQYIMIIFQWFVVDFLQIMISTEQNWLEKFALFVTTQSSSNSPFYFMILNCNCACAVMTLRIHLPVIQSSSPNRGYHM